MFEKFSVIDLIKTRSASVCTFAGNVVKFNSRQKENPNVPLSGFQKKRSKSSPARCWAQ